jgi:hypothetical protein
MQGYFNSTVVLVVEIIMNSISNNSVVLVTERCFVLTFFFSLSRNQQSEYWVLYELMCWLANCRGEVPSSEEISVVD